MSDVKLGSRVRVTKPDGAFSEDYAQGSTGVVRVISGDGVSVTWDKPFYHDWRDDCRQEYLFFREFEVITDG